MPEGQNLQSPFAFTTRLGVGGQAFMPGEREVQHPSPRTVGLGHGRMAGPSFLRF